MTDVVFIDETVEVANLDERLDALEKYVSLVTLSDLQSATSKDTPVTYDRSIWVFTSGDFTGRINNATVVKGKDTSISSGAWCRQYDELDPTWFGAVGLSAIVDTPALQAAIDVGGIINLGRYDSIPFLVNKTIMVSKPGTVLKGQRKIQTTAEVINTDTIKITGNDSVIDGITLISQTQNNPQTGYQTWGISIAAHRCKITNCSVYDFQMCMGVLPTGEWYDNKITNNYCRVLGAGDGPVNQTSSLGEDRGHGIADFGARTTIVGNTVQAGNARYGNNGNGNGSRIPGSDYNDCCLGIVTEALPGYGDETGPDNSSGTTIAFNHVIPSDDGKGRFRRCYSIEGMRTVRFEGNFGRGWTWDGLWLVGTSSHSLVLGNTFICDTNPDDKTGAAWAPLRSGILIYVQSNLVIENLLVSNNIVLANSAHSSGIFVQSAGATPRHINITNNRCFSAVPSGSNFGIGIYGGGGSVLLTNNAVTGLWYNGVYADASNRVVIDGGIIEGTSSSAISGTFINNMTITNVVIGNCAAGIYAFTGSYFINNNETAQITNQTIISGGSTTLRIVNNTATNGDAVMFLGGVVPIEVRNNSGYSAFKGSVAYSPAEILDGTGITVDVPLAATLPKDTIKVSYSQPLSGMFMIGSVKSAGIVSVRIQNWSGSNLILNAGNITAAMERTI